MTAPLVIHGGTVDEAVAFVIQRAAREPVNVIVDKHIEGGLVVATPTAVYVSGAVGEALRALVTP